MKNSLKALLLVAVLVLSFAPCQAEKEDEKDNRIKYDYVTDNPDASESSSSRESEPPDSARLYAQVEKLVKEYFPKAKFKIEKNTLNGKYKTRPYVIASTNKVEQGPKWGGVLFEMTLNAGKYKGVHSVPKKFNEYSFFHVVLMAPYSQSKNCHLLTRISYPFDVPPEFLKRFTNLVNDFENYL